MLSKQCLNVTIYGLLCGTATLAGCVSTLDDQSPEVEGVAQNIVDGLQVSGAGSDERWEGIVGLWLGEPGAMLGAGCTGFFISDSHIVTAAHCVNHSGRFAVQYHAPGLDWTAVSEASVTIPGCFNGPGNRSCDVAVISLDSPEPWATEARRFRLYGGGTIRGTFLHAYGYGFTRNGDGAPSGELMTGPDHASFPITSHRDGYFETTARSTNICHGDSGGPALQEDSNPDVPPIVWGVLSKFKEPAGANRNCVSDGNMVAYAKTTTNIDWIETVIGHQCTDDGSGRDAYVCW